MSSGSESIVAVCLIKEKYTIPPGAYVRSADYYWSFNEFVDSGPVQIFQNTGEHSFGLFNASASYIQQQNDSIHNGSTWYTIKFNQIKKQCITIPGFDNENHTCLVDPNQCTNGLSMEVWLKFQRSDLESDVLQAIISAGNSAAGGHGGFFVYQVGRTVTIIIANGTHYWLVDKNLPNTIQAGDWFNLGFRWKADKGIQMFINSELAEEIPFARVATTPRVPSDNKMYVGCMKLGISEPTDYADYEMDELAFWKRYLPDHKIKDFTGGIIEPEEIEPTIFRYYAEINELEPPKPPTTVNPFYEVADFYEVCDNLHTPFSTARVSTTRGTGFGVTLTNISSSIILSNSQGAASLESGRGLAVGLWVLPIITDTDEADILKGNNWLIKISNGNITIVAKYVVLDVNETKLIEETVSYGISLVSWTNIGVSWMDTIGLELYINGIPKTTEAYTEKAELTGSNFQTEADELVLYGSSLNITTTDIIAWKRYLYEFEAYRFVGMSPSEAYLDRHADLYWSTDYWVSSDKNATATRLPIYQTRNSSVRATDNQGIQGHTNKGQAMTLSENNGWIMLGLENNGGVITEHTGNEFAETCLSDPSLCDKGLTLALWLIFEDVPTSRQLYTIMSSGEEDTSFSRGFSITMQNKDISITLVDGERYWRVTVGHGIYPVGNWMHLAFSWKVDEGLWVFLNGELLAANTEPLNQQRPYDRYSKITMGRSNANNDFAGLIGFTFQEIAVYFRFTVTYRIRELFALVDNPHYEKADKYYNKETLITSTIDILKHANQLSLEIGPKGQVSAFNNTISLSAGAWILLEYMTATDCIINPSHCSNGITVSTWTRTNLFLTAEDDPVYLISSHQSPEEVVAGNLNGWTIYYIEESFKVALVSNNVQYTCSPSVDAKALLAQRWTNIAFTWSASTGMTLILDGQVAGILKYGTPVEALTPDMTHPALMVGHRSNSNKTFVGIFNLAIWEKYYFGSRGYELTGHTEKVIAKYSEADLMWSFDGPIHLVNNKYSEMIIREETYDGSLVGAAVAVSRDGLRNASLGNYSSECITQPSSCSQGFQLSLDLWLAPYTPGEGADSIGSVFLLGSPDANFEGLAIQMINEDGNNKLVVWVTNGNRFYKRTINVEETNKWFELVIGWNIKDGIAIKVNNKKIFGKDEGEVLKFGSSKLITNNLILGVGSGGGTNQGVDAKYNDIAITYNGKVAVEQAGRCYETCSLYYRLNKGQIFAMENVDYTIDREKFSESAFKLKENAYVELDQFIDHCFSDPSLCTNGFSLSMYVMIASVPGNGDFSTLLSTGYPGNRGYQVAIGQGENIDELLLTVKINNGVTTWTAETNNVTLNRWTNIGFTWNLTDATGLSLYIDGILVDRERSAQGVEEVLPEKVAGMTLVIGRGNNASADTDFCDATFDDIGIWDHLISEDTEGVVDVGTTLMGQQCGDDNSLLVAAEIAAEIPQTTMNLTEVTDRPADCKFYDSNTGLCAPSILVLVEVFHNKTELKINTIPDVLREVDSDLAVFQLNNTETEPDDLLNIVNTVKTFSVMPIDSEVDPRVAKDCMNSILSVANTALKPSQWKEQWGEVDFNSTNGPASLLESVEILALKFTKSLIVGLDKVDDCSAFTAGNDGILMSSQQRRLPLCDEPYVFPQYDKMVEDETLNASLKQMQPSDKVVIPVSTWPKNEYPDDAIVSISIILYDEADDIFPTRMDLGTFIDLEATTSADNPEDFIDPDQVKQATLNSRIISVLVDPVVPPPLEECVLLTFEHTETNTDNKRTGYCAFWDKKVTDFEGGAWSSEGCEVSETNETHTVCCCYHMTSFAVMMEPLVIPPVDTTLRTKALILYICIGTSFFCLLLFALIVLCNKSLRSERNMVHLNLCISMMLALGSYLTVHWAKEVPVYCQAAAIAQHYFFMVAFAWILIEALCLFYAVLYGQLVGKMKCYAPMAWLVPAGIVILCLALYLDQYGLNDRCWLTYNKYIIMAMLGPILFSIFLDMMVLLVIICNLPQPTLKREDILSEVRWAVFYAMLLVPVLAFTWTLPLLDVLKISLPEIFDYVYIAVFSLQGFFCFVVFGLGQRSVRMGLMRKKYQPAYPSSVLFGSRNSSNLSDPGLVEVKPQPLHRPSPRTANTNPSPRDQAVEQPSSADSRRSSVSSSSSEEGGYIP